MSPRPSAKALITTGICLLGGALLLQLVYQVAQGAFLTSYYGGMGTFGWGAFGLFGTVINLTGFTGAALLGAGLVVKALTSAPRPDQPHQPYGGQPTGYGAPQAPAQPPYGSGGYPAPGYQGYPGQQQPPQQ